MALALFMDSKISFQCFCEIFLTGTIRRAVISRKIPPEDERNTLLFKPFVDRTYVDIQSSNQAFCNSTNKCTVLIYYMNYIIT
jgi:hypothetical protein